jgi:hypothetical protein
MNYPSLQKLLGVATERDLETLLAREIENERRYTFLVRIHQRLSALRASRERKELLMQTGYADRVNNEN